jgi:hypothetical protein
VPASEKRAAKFRPHLVKAKDVQQLVIQSSMREAAKLYSDGSIGERKSASGAARVGERRHRPF